MPPVRFLTRRRIVLAVLLLTGALGAVDLLASWGTESPERATYNRIQVGMDNEQVDAILRDWLPKGLAGNMGWHTSDWQAPNGAMVYVTFDSDGRATDKSFKEGDLSLTGSLKRLVGWRTLP
jgi:hypothetical protein